MWKYREELAKEIKAWLFVYETRTGTPPPTTFRRTATRTLQPAKSLSSAAPNAHCTSAASDDVFKFEMESRSGFRGAGSESCTWVVRGNLSDALGSLSGESIRHTRTKSNICLSVLASHRHNACKQCGGGELTFTVANRGGISSASRCSSGGESESMANTVSPSFGIGSFVRLDIT